jgi:phosphonate transport system substrate-binding protein
LGRKELSFALTWQRNTEPVGSAVAELLRWLGQRIGRPVVPRVALSYDELMPLFERDEADVAWLPPLSFLQLRTKGLARTLLVNQRHATRAFHTVLAVRSGSRHYALDKLRGARAAWIDPFSTTGYLLPRLELAAHGIDPRTTLGEERFFGSHDAAARAVLEGRSDVLGTFAEYDGDRITRAGFSTQGTASDWRILLKGRESPSDVLAARASLDDATCDTVKTALREALADPTALPLVREVLHVEGFSDTDDPRYAALADAVESARKGGLFPHL